MLQVLRPCVLPALPFFTDGPPPFCPPLAPKSSHHAAILLRHDPDRALQPQLYSPWPLLHHQHRALSF